MYIKWDSNSIPDFLTREFLQNRSWCLRKQSPKTRGSPSNPAYKTREPQALYKNPIFSYFNCQTNQILVWGSYWRRRNYKTPTWLNSVGLTPFPNCQNYSWHYKKCLNRPPVILSLKQVIFLNHFRNIKEAFLLQNPSFLYNKPVFQKPNPNIFSILLFKIF